MKSTQAMAILLVFLGSFLADAHAEETVYVDTFDSTRGNAKLQLEVYDPSNKAMYVWTHVPGNQSIGSTEWCLDTRTNS